MKKEKKKLKKEGKTKTIITTLLLAIIAVGICFCFKPIFQNLKFGLDLQGGFEVLYEVESIDGSKMTKEKMQATYKTLSKRIDSLGVSEPEIILEGNNKIRVKLAGVKNEEEARKQLSTVATLSFRDADDNLLMTSDILNESHAAKLSEDAKGNPAISLSIKDKDKFYNVTNRVKDYDNNIIVIWLDYQEGEDSYQAEGANCGTEGSNCLSEATVSQAFASDVIIQGNFTQEEASNLVDLINSGSLPSKLTEISSKTVEASFGDNTFNKIILAGVIGMLLIVVTLIFCYHFSGLISTICMLIYTILVFAVFWTVGGVLTLPGIAALILGIGMAVDSNVITFSRIRDELYKGKSLETAYKLGTKESLSSILDANITTLVVAIIMFIFGESSIKGYATMSIITVFVTMFTMVFLTRYLIGLFVKTKYFNNRTYLFINVDKEDIPNVSKGEDVKVQPFKNVNFISKTKYFATFSIIVIVAGAVMIGVKGLNLGVDFKSGSDIALVTNEKLTKEGIEQDLKELKLISSEITITNDQTDILVTDVLSDSELKTVKDYFKNKYNASVDIGVISNVVKQDLIKNAIYAVLISIVGIIIYVSLRFKFSYAIGGIVALLHDVAMMFSVFALARLEVNTMFIAAVLAIIGYSINDTIVCFDRIRENLKQYDKKMTKDKLIEIVNRSMQETFVRTIVTAVTTIFCIVGLILFGPKDIFAFDMAMLIGSIAGTYSSIFIAINIFIALESKNLNKPKKTKKVYKDDIEEKLIKGVNC